METPPLSLIEMRVAFVAARTTFHHETERLARLRDIAAGLVARGHEVTWLCARWWEGPHDEYESDDGVVYRGIADAPTSRWYPLKLPGALRSLSPDVVHAAADVPGHAVAARTGATLARAPLLVDWYDWETATPSSRLRSWFAPAFRRRAANAPDRLVAPSRTVKTRIREYGAEGADVSVIPTGVDFETIRGTDPEERADIVYARELDADANLESLLLALAEFRTREWTAAVVGDGPEREAYEKQARELRIDDRVEFLGNQPVERRLALFRGAHAAVYTGRRTPFPADLVRALACGCVGIVEYHADSAAHEFVEREERGFRVTDEAELAAALRAAGDIERKDVDESFERFGAGPVLKRYLDCYRELRA